MKNKKYYKLKNCDLESNYIMKNGILIGCHQGLTKKHIDYIHNKIKNFLVKICKIYSY